MSGQAWGVQQRDAYAAAIDSTLRKLSEFPELGRKRDELGAGLRTFPVEQHVIVYRFTESELIVLRVFHGRMDLPGRLKK